MSRFVDIEFDADDSVLLDGNEFVGCSFDGTTIVFRGGDVCVQGGWFNDPKIVFEGAAAQTFSFIAKLGSMPGAQGWLEQVLEQLRGWSEKPSSPNQQH